MRYLDILMFVLCINIAIFIMSEMQVYKAFGDTQVMTAETEWIESYNETARAETVTPTNPLEFDFWIAAGMMVWKAIAMLLRVFASIILLYPMLLQLGVPSTMALGISSVIYFIYLWGIIQFFSNRSGKNIE